MGYDTMSDPSRCSVTSVGLENSPNQSFSGKDTLENLRANQIFQTSFNISFIINFSQMNLIVLVLLLIAGCFTVHTDLYACGLNNYASLGLLALGEHYLEWNSNKSGDGFFSYNYCHKLWICLFCWKQCKWTTWDGRHS